MNNNFHKTIYKYFGCLTPKLENACLGKWAENEKKVNIQLLFKRYSKRATWPVDRIWSKFVHAVGR